MAQKLQMALALFGLSVLAVIVLELVASTGAVLYSQFLSRSEWFDNRSQSPAYNPIDQPQILYQEFSESNTREYRPYVGWSRSFFEGTIVNVNEYGDRATKYNSTRTDSLQLWVLGGSTVWGFGAPDSETIPSHLANLLNGDWKVDTTVRNLGEGGFVSTQEVARLILELQRGDRPDVVVIYDGVNDAYAGTYSPGVPGATQYQGQISALVEQRDAKGNWIRSLGLFRVSEFLLRKAGIETNLAFAEANSVPDSELRVRADETANIWLQNYQVVSALSEAYGFQLIMALQPNLFVSEKPLQPFELEILEKSQQDQPVFVQGTRLAYSAIQDRLRSGEYERIYDFTDAFDSIPSSIYIDEMHIIGAGNQRLAEMIYAAVQTQICVDIPQHVSQHVNDQITARCSGSS